MQFTGKKTLQATFEFNDSELRALETLGESTHNDLRCAGMSHECADLLHAIYYKVKDLLENSPT